MARAPEVRQRGLRSRTLQILLGLATALMVLFSWLVARHLRRDARQASISYAAVFRALADTSASAATEALLQQANAIKQEGIPLVITNSAGVATDTANLPRTMALDSPEMRAFVARLDRANEPIAEPGLGAIHYGSAPVRTQLRLVLALLVTSLLAVLVSLLLARRAEVRGSQDRAFVAMARESAHQLGTPLTSLAGWIEQLRSSADPATRELAEHVAADYRRLDRVSRRFERIGQPPRTETVDVGALATAAASYFRPRLPRLANAVTMDVEVKSQAPLVRGDALLLEWALEALLKNAVDAMKGRSGTIRLTVADEPEHVVLAVEDEGPGLPPDLGDDVFEPGVTTKTGGWGLGLALTRRIIEDGHGGSVTIAPSATGARFLIRLPRAGDA